MNPSSSVPCSPESTRLRNKHCYSRVSPGRHLISLAYPPRIRSASGAMGVKLDCSHELFVLLSTRTAAVHRNRTEDSLISRCVRPLCRVPLSVKEPANPACGRKWGKERCGGVLMTADQADASSTSTLQTPPHWPGESIIQNNNLGREPLCL